MTIIGLLILLLVIFVLWKLFIDGWLFKIILFFAGWFGLYIWLRSSVEGAKHVAFTLSNGSAFTWAAVIPTVVCVLCLLCTKVKE